MTLDRWEAGRTVVLSFADQEFNPLNPQFAAIRETDVQSRTVITFELAPLGNERLCSTGHVDASGVYVRDTDCARVAGGADQPLFFSFQLQCPTCTNSPQPPDIICHDISPPPPTPVSAATMLPSQHENPAPAASQSGGWSAAGTFQYLSPSPPPLHSPPPLLSPPPSPPRIEATQCASGGLAEVRRHVRGYNEQETLNIVVRPTHWWPTGYVYVVGLRGLQLRVWNPEGAIMQEHQQREVDEMHVHHYVFTPEQAHPSFSFNVDGVDVLLVSLTCRVPHSPPNPPLMSPPPPSPAAPSGQGGLPFSLGLRSFSSRVAVGVIAFIVIMQMVLSLRRMCGCDSTRAIVSASEGAADAGMAAVAAEDDCWTVLIVLNGKEVELELPHHVASSADDLRHALSELASEALGPRTVPAEWIDGDLRTMRVQYVDADEQPLTMKSSTRLAELCDSPYLRVSVGR